MGLVWLSGCRAGFLVGAFLSVFLVLVCFLFGPDKRASLWEPTCSVT